MDEMFKSILDNISEGVIVIDTEGRITNYNKKAKEIFGILQRSLVKHSGGSINEGDLVFISDNKIGVDDGNLDYKGLETIGIYDETIKKGDSILAFGIYKDKNNKYTSYKKVEKAKQSGYVELKGRYKNHTYNLGIDYVNRVLKIQVDDIDYHINYENSAGNMVIIRENQLIFCQQRGYTARGEEIKNILKGTSFRAKGEDVEDINPIGSFIFDIHERNEEMDSFYKCAVEKDINISNEFMNINGIATVSSIMPLYMNKEKFGAMIKIEDVTELKKIIEERNVLLKNLKEKEELLEDEKILKAFKSFDGISRHIRATKLMAYKSSKTNSTVLILGESGIGKGALAQEIHDLSPRRNNRFLHINCASLPEELLESELFGYEEGVFGNSKGSGKKGLLELASGGTLFLDEIGDMSLKTQAKVLNFLQEKSFYRLGGIEEIKVDTRIICATNKNLEEAIQEGSFREDLYYRINIIPIYIEPLRKRFEDIPIIVEKLIPRISERLGRNKVHITSEAMNKLVNYSWPGNVRELENILERAISLSDSDIIYSQNINLDNASNLEENIALDNVIEEKPLEKGLKKALEEAEKEIIIEVLKRNHGDGKEAINELQIGKTSFYDKIKKYNLKLEDYKEKDYI